MEKFVITGGHTLQGTITANGAKNVAIKAILAGLLTDNEITIRNAPNISDLSCMIDIVRDLGVHVSFSNHTLIIKGEHITHSSIPLALGARLRTSVLAIGPLVARFGKAKIPNPGGCRIGARPIDRHIEGLERMGVRINYESDDGFFHASADALKGIRYCFPKNTHTGTETLLLAAVLADGETILENAAEEPEVDDLIALLVSMGARIKRQGKRVIRIQGVKKLSGCTYRLMSDRNEAVTFAIAALVTNGDITVHGAQKKHLTSFLEKLDAISASYEIINSDTIRFFKKNNLQATDVTTAIHPGFMTDWQAPWAVLMTQAHGTSIIHEAVFEDRFSYISELKKLGANITLFNPPVAHPKQFYNFNWEDNQKNYYHAARIIGPTRLHNGVLNISDLRAGATLVLAALAGHGRSDVYGVEHIDRGYERIEERLSQLGGKIKRVAKLV